MKKQDDYHNAYDNIYIYVFVMKMRKTTKNKDKDDEGLTSPNVIMVRLPVA